MVHFARHLQVIAAQMCLFCCWQQINTGLNTHTLSSVLSPINHTPSTSFTCTTCHMHALPSHTPQPTTDNVLHRTTEGTPTYRPSTQSPCHVWLGPSGTLQGWVWALHHAPSQLHSGPWWIQDWLCCGAVTPYWEPGSGWCWHGHPMQLGAGHCVHSTKREST